MRRKIIIIAIVGSIAGALAAQMATYGQWYLAGVLFSAGAIIAGIIVNQYDS